MKSWDVVSTGSPLAPLFVLLFALQASAGQEVGNGGGAFVCRDAQGRITSAELVDLFVARARYGMTVPVRDMAPIDAIMDPVTRARAMDQTVDVELWTAMNKNRETTFVVSPDRDLLLEAVWYARENASFVGPEARLKQFDDSGQPLEKAGCPREQLANFTNTDELLIQKEIWDKLDVTNRAAFWLHEAVYWSDRIAFTETDSLHAAYLVGRLFSTFEFVRTFDGMSPDPETSWSCYNRWSFNSPTRQEIYFWLFKQRNGLVRAQFTQLLGYDFFGKITATEPGWSGDCSGDMLRTGEPFEGFKGVTCNLNYDPNSFFMFRGRGTNFRVVLRKSSSDAKLLDAQVRFRDPVTGEMHEPPGIECRREVFVPPSNPLAPVHIPSPMPTRPACP